MSDIRSLKKELSWYKKALKRDKKKYEKNKDKIKKRIKEYSQSEHFKEVRGKWLENNKDNLKQYNKEYNKEYREKNKDTLREKYKERLRVDEQTRVKHYLRSRMNATIRNGYEKAYKLKGKRLPSHKLLGCSWEKVKDHLESLFKEGMSWENHGRKGWHIDHIIPCASFDLTKIEEQKKCFHYTNLQPLWWWENLEKGDKID
jgi:hypothetical protein